jgi:hypothetical protein
MTELDANRVPRHTGRDVDIAEPTEAEHHMKCPGCGRWFDMRDLGEVAEHIHDAGEIDIEERTSFRLRKEAAN